MAYKTNSKQAIMNIRNYIMDGFRIENDGIVIDATDYNRNFRTIANLIVNEFMEEKGYYINRYGMQATFIDWMQGLPSIIDSCYYYNRSAIDDLGDLLNQSESERHKFTEEQAELTLTKLIYRELMKEYGRV